MKICIAQVKPVTGDILLNIDNHIKYIKLASSLRAEAIFFPELSLTGYEPTLAKALAINQNDKRLRAFQKISNTSNIIIGVGAPTRHENGICISMILFQPNIARKLYSKQYLHKEEELYFIPGKKSRPLQLGEQRVAIAICYEISIPAHCKNAIENGATIYLASVAKFRDGIEKAQVRLATIAEQYSMTVLMANCVGMVDSQKCAGKSTVWNDRGLILAQLDETHEGLLILDTRTGIVSEIF